MAKPALCKNAEGCGRAGRGAGARAASGPGTQARPDTRLSPASAPRSRRPPSRARACPRRRAAAASALGLKLRSGRVCALGRVRACSSAPPSLHPGPSTATQIVTQRSGKRRHLRQQEAENLSSGLLPGKRRISSVAHLHREAGGAQGVRSVRIAQGTVNKPRRWCSSRPRPGTCPAAPQRPASAPRLRPCHDP